MYAEAVALLAAFSFASAAIALKKGYRFSTPLASSLVVLAVNSVLLWILALLFVPLKHFFSISLIFFIVGGLLGQGIARTFRYSSMNSIGASRTYTIVGASPFFAAFFAMIFLNEKWTLPLIGGTLLVFTGISLLAGDWKKHKFKKVYLLFPVAAAIIYGFVAILQKTGLSFIPNAIVGATTAVTSAFLGLLIFSLLTNKLKTMKVGKAWPYFVAGGVLNSVAFILNFEALRVGNVTVVMPLTGTQPLFVTLLSLLFLKGVEKITGTLIAGALLIVVGAGIITAF